MDQPNTATTVPIIDSSEKKSSKAWIYVVILILILVVSFGSYKFLIMKSVTGSNQVAKNLPTVTPTPNPDIPTNNSNDQLDKDTQAIESNTTNLTNDLNNIDQGLNDQSVNLN